MREKMDVSENDQIKWVRSAANTTNKDGADIDISESIQLATIGTCSSILCSTTTGYTAVLSLPPRLR